MKIIIMSSECRPGSNCGRLRRTPYLKPLPTRTILYLEGRQRSRHEHPVFLLLYVILLSSNKVKVLKFVL